MENRTRQHAVFKGKQYEVNYIQEPRYGNRGEITICYINIDGYNNRKQIIAKSERSPRDNYISKQGYDVAFGRLIKKIEKLEKVL